MTAGDDPEERIAELERPLLQSAAESEYPATAPRVGLRLGWAVLALMIVGLIVTGVAVFGGRPGGAVSGRPTTPGGVGPVVQSPAAPTTPLPPKSRPLPSNPTGAAPSSPPFHGAVSVSGVGGKRTIDCADNVVSISGVNNEVTLTGHCRSVDVSGVENTVTTDATDAIVVSGMKNTVTFRSGTPELTNSGFDNIIAGP